MEFLLIVKYDKLKKKKRVGIVESNLITLQNQYLP